MKRIVFRFSILTGVFFLVTSCAGVSLSRYQNDFNQFYNEKEACQSRELKEPKELDITKIESIPCTEEAKAKLYDLAQSAVRTAGNARDQRTKVALLRLAGVSLWQSGRGTEEEGNALENQITLEGQAICETLEAEAKKENIYGAPRDCAILTILPALVWHSEYYHTLKELKGKKPTEDRKKALKEIISNYPNNTVLYVVAKETTAKSFTGLSDTVKDYIEEVKRRSFCNYLMTEEIVLGRNNDLYLNLKPEVKKNIKSMGEKTDLNRLDDCR